MVYISFLILPNLVSFFILLRNLISVLFILLLCLSSVIHNPHECANIGFTTLLTTFAFTSCGISILLRKDVFTELYSVLVLVILLLISSSECLDC